MTIKELHTEHPTKVEKGVLYMKFGEYWFAIGRDAPGVAEWQYERMVGPAIERSPGLA